MNCTTCLTVAEHQGHRQRKRHALSAFDAPRPSPGKYVEDFSPFIDFESPTGDVVAYRCGCLQDARDLHRVRFSECPEHGGRTIETPMTKEELGVAAALLLCELERVAERSTA